MKEIKQIAVTKDGIKMYYMWWYMSELAKYSMILAEEISLQLYNQLCYYKNSSKMNKGKPVTEVFIFI
jgi:hypothetical protein